VACPCPHSTGQASPPSWPGSALAQGMRGGWGWGQDAVENWPPDGAPSWGSVSYSCYTGRFSSSFLSTCQKVSGPPSWGTPDSNNSHCLCENNGDSCDKGWRSGGARSTPSSSALLDSLFLVSAFARLSGAPGASFVQSDQEPTFPSLGCHQPGLTSGPVL
jgi:hypothetical protein